jgi:hypothetical protein
MDKKYDFVGLCVLYGHHEFQKVLSAAHVRPSVRDLVKATELPTVFSQNSIQVFVTTVDQQTSFP